MGVRVVRRLKLVFCALLSACLLAEPALAVGTSECSKPKGWQPTPRELHDILQTHKGWTEQIGGWVEQMGWQVPTIPGSANLCNANLSGADLSGAILSMATLSGANLSRADLRGATLLAASLDEADLFLANLSGADLTGANLSLANLSLANLSGAGLFSADLSGAYLVDTKLENAKLTGADLTDAEYEAASAPAKGHLTGLRGLITVQFRPGRHSGLVQLRKALQEAGLRRLEREATYALESGITRHALNGWEEEPKEGLLKRFFTDPAPIIEGVLRLFFFEWTTGWGLHYGRPILILLGLIGIMTIIYMAVIAMPGRAGKQSGIFRIWPEGRIEETGEGFEAADDTKVERLNAKGLPVFGYALYFSLLSAFHIGWRDLNVGSWLARLQFREYALRARGWVRFFSGLQSLVSVYLLAMWALTYFGRPFQ